MVEKINPNVAVNFCSVNQTSTTVFQKLDQNSLQSSTIEEQTSETKEDACFQGLTNLFQKVIDCFSSIFQFFKEKFLWCFFKKTESPEVKIKEEVQGLYNFYARQDPTHEAFKIALEKLSPEAQEAIHTQLIIVLNTVAWSQNDNNSKNVDEEAAKILNENSIDRNVGIAMNNYLRLKK